MKRKILLALAGLCAAALIGCSTEAPDAGQLLVKSQEALDSLDSYSMRLSADLRATPENGDGVAQPSFAVDTYTQFTTGCTAMNRSSQFTMYKDWSWHLASAEEYRFPQGEESDCYYAWDNLNYTLRQEPTADYTPELASFFREATASSVRYEGERAYLLTGPLADAHLDVLLPEDGAACRILRQIPDTATVRTYLDADTLLPINTEIIWDDPDGAILDAIDCRGGKLNICRITMTYNSFNELVDLKMPPELADAQKLPEGWQGHDLAKNMLTLSLKDTRVQLPLPLTYTGATWAGDASTAVMRQTHEGNSYQVTMSLTDRPVISAPEPVVLPDCTVTQVENHTMEPLTIDGRTITGAYTTYRSINEKEVETFVARYNLSSALEDGTILRCLVQNSTTNENIFAVDPEPYAQQFFTGLKVS